MEILLYSYIFVLGCVLGSFFNVLGIRVPKKETLGGRSHCCNCEHTLGVVELIPILGYIILGGKCKECKQKIPIKYPAMELLTGLLFLFTSIRFIDNIPQMILVLLFISLMVTITVSDIYYKIVPTIFIFVFGIFILTFSIWVNIDFWYMPLLIGLISFVIMSLIAYVGERISGKMVLGGGDIKLYSIIGILMADIMLVILSLFIASLVGTIFQLVKNKIMKTERGYFAFVPFIFIGAIISYFYGEQILDWYLGLFNIQGVIIYGINS